ncbi:MAG TPA: dTDP-glucose 4,6-dehydratase, partial [Thermoanaerobaculia bacterium]
METLIVTGGAGFIGSSFVRLALAELPGTRVVVFDKLTYAGNLANLADVAEHPNYVFVQGDIADRDDVHRVFASHRPTALVNFAAESHVDRSIEDPSAFVRTNVGGAFELLEGARRHHRELPAGDRERFRFLHVSTDEVYGSLGPEGHFTEESPYAPNSPYAASKAAADHFVRAYHETYGLPALVTNCSNNYGPYQFPEKLIPLMILNALEGRDLPVYGDGSNVRDWIYVEDHCRGVLRALEAGRPGEKYNLGGGAERANLEIVHTICDLLEAARPARENEALAARGADSYRDLVSFVADRP